MQRLLTACLCIFFVQVAFSWQEVSLTKTETLGSIAEKYRPNGVSRMDMVIAIRNANPHVFSSQDAFRPGVELQVPTTEREVRQAITGKFQVNVPATVKSNTATPLPAAKKALAPQKIVTGAKAASGAPAKHNTLQQKQVAPQASVKPASLPILAKTKTAKQLQKNKVVAAPVAKPPVLSVSKKTTATNSEAVTKLANANVMVKALQQSVNNQKQTISSYQDQLNQMTGQLNILQRQNQDLSAQLANKESTFSSAKNLSNLWLVLWLFTLLLLLYQFHKHRSALLNDGNTNPLVDHDFASGFEPTLNMSLGQESSVALKGYEGEVKASKTAESWEQVELDIPVVSAEQSEPNISAHALEFYEDKALAGEQQNIINAIAGDLDNVDWHRALLEFYIKTDNQHGFNRHYQSMLTGALMQEGDKLWEEVRKMYLSKWIYTPAA